MGVYLHDGGQDRTAYREVRRQAAVDRADPFRFTGDERLQRIVLAAAEAYDTAASAISIISWQRQVLIVRTGTDVHVTPRDGSICEFAIQQPGEPLVVPDARLDPRFSRRATVVLPPCVRFYAGHAIVDAAGYALGALCVFDPVPRHDPPDASALIQLARAAERVIFG